ncbi:MAG: SAM-dependent methyltransferase, partial [Ilumatobacteraceae bacterium]
MLHDYFGAEIAASYDDSTDVRFTSEHLALESLLLAQLAGPGGRALELAIGTGRAALPLAGRGIDVA